MEKKVSPEDVSRWMIGEIEREGRLSQSVAAREIRERFGEDFVYKNENKNLAIRKDILDAFRFLTGREIVWVYGFRCWRKRKPTDPPYKRQVNGF